MGYAGEPNRSRGLVIGIVGGLIGEAVALVYRREVLHSFLPETNSLPSGEPEQDFIEKRALMPIYQPGETLNETLGRIGYEIQNEHPPVGAEKTHAANVAALVQGALFGAMYGATRTTTRPRDFAAGFFYGVRLWAGETFFAPLLGLRPGPSRLRVETLIGTLTIWIVYSFVTTNVTRLIYWLLFPEDRPENQNKRRLGVRARKAIKKAHKVYKERIHH